MPTKKTILITGASCGMGEATALHLASLGHNVVLGARRLERLHATAGKIEDAGGQAFAQSLDVTDLEDFRKFVAGAKERFGSIDVLVNNAGVMPLSMIGDLRVDEWNEMIDVNFRGVLNGIAAVLPSMKAQSRGHIVNVASVSAHRVDPSAAVYAATKFAVRALSDGLRQETKEIRVTVVSPGLTRTELFEGIKIPDIKGFLEQIAEASSIPASAVANAIGYAIEQPPEVDINEIIVRPTAQG
jgi:NADP-dependent 3-hydroxy acid dehydrogenase YdfG